jgi:hypothetical protein
MATSTSPSLRDLSVAMSPAFGPGSTDSAAPQPRSTPIDASPMIAATGRVVLCGFGMVVLQVLRVVDGMCHCRNEPSAGSVTNLDAGSVIPALPPANAVPGIRMLAMMPTARTCSQRIADGRRPVVPCRSSGRGALALSEGPESSVPPSGATRNPRCRPTVQELMIGPIDQSDAGLAGADDVGLLQSPQDGSQRLFR